MRSGRGHAFSRVRRTLRISCEAVPPSVVSAGAQGGTSACSTGAALSFVSCIRLLGRPPIYSRSFRKPFRSTLKPSCALTKMSNMRS